MAIGTVATDIAGRILELRAVTGLTQDGLGELAGVNGRQVYAWEKGHAIPPRTKLERLARHQGWPVDMFAEGGPRPRTCVKGPMVAPKRRSGQDGYQEVYVKAVTELAAHMDRGNDMPPERVLYWLSAMLEASSPPSGGVLEGRVEENGG